MVTGGWKIEKSINLSHIITIGILLWGAATWADDAHDNLTSRMNSVEQTLDHHKAMFEMQQRGTVEEVKRQAELIVQLQSQTNELTVLVRELTTEIRALKEGRD